MAAARHSSPNDDQVCTAQKQLVLEALPDHLRIIDGGDNGPVVEGPCPLEVRMVARNTGNQVMRENRQTLPAR